MYTQQHWAWTRSTTPPLTGSDDTDGGMRWTQPSEIYLIIQPQWTACKMKLRDKNEINLNNLKINKLKMCCDAMRWGVKWYDDKAWWVGVCHIRFCVQVCWGWGFSLHSSKVPWIIQFCRKPFLLRRAEQWRAGGWGHPSWAGLSPDALCCTRAAHWLMFTWTTGLKRRKEIN